MLIFYIFFEKTMYRKENRFEDIYCIDTLTLLTYFYLLLKINLAALQLWQHGDTKKLVCSITITIFIGSPPYFNGMGISEILVSYRQVNFIYGDLILSQKFGKRLQVLPSLERFLRWRIR